jgi:serine/threonine protein kinase
MATLPSHISRYEIKSRIGRGGMGDLYLALDPSTNRLVVVKLLNATLDSSELRERFSREARALAALNHPNIVNIYDTGEFDDSPFIVMEYVRGETLAEMIKRRAALSVSQKLELMEELCAGLAQAHEADIIHRDIKPANLMVDRQGRLKILDFGIAHVAEGHKSRVGPLTQVNMMIGTPGYMSPEQIEGGEIDHRSDIFAVGAVCYELLSYDEAFPGTNTHQIEAQVLRGRPAPLTSRVPGLDPDIDEIVLRALKRDPNKRYQDAATFERALARVRSRLGPDEPGPPDRPTPPPPHNLRGKSREVRAEAAYQRALAFFQGGAVDAARRSAIEALAEDPSHAATHAFLARLDHRGSPVDRSVAAVPAQPAAPTIVGTVVGGAASTVVSGPTEVSGSTVVSRAPAPWTASPPTILVPPPVARKPPVWKRYRTLWEGLGAFGTRRRPPATRERASGKGREPIWTRYPRAALAAALLAIVAGLAAIVMLVTSWLQPSGHLLTITKPVGGTISSAGIRCGTRGADCSTHRPNGDAIELTFEEDAGYAFVGYTGDCAPSGWTVMTAARTCGATFEAVPAAPPVTTQLLKISPVPTGGTLEGVDILCGTKGSVCEAQHPEGVRVDLHAVKDPGFTFMGFQGDCAPLGQTQMLGPRTCGATFSPTASVSVPPVLPPRNAGGVKAPGRGDAAGAGGSSSTTGPPHEPPANAGASRTVDVPPVADGDKISIPPTREEFAKGKIRELLKEYCDAYEALDPDAVKRLFPEADMRSLRIQLNKSRYRSVQCKFADPVFIALDASAGKATIRVDVKRVFEHTAGGSKPEIKETTAVMTLSRSRDRSVWVIDAATYKEK